MVEFERDVLLVMVLPLQCDYIVLSRTVCDWERLV